MSLVLGPIHHWMYGKIKTTMAREASIVAAFKAKYSADADKILDAVYKKHPKADANQPLEKLLGNKAIHQGIQELIVKTETREASIIAAFCAKHDDAGKVAGEAARMHGVSCGKEAIKSKGCQPRIAAIPPRCLRQWVITFVMECRVIGERTWSLSRQNERLGTMKLACMKHTGRTPGLIS